MGGALKQTNDVLELAELARGLRVDILKMLNTAGSGHTGGSLSAIDILTALYFSRLRHDPKNSDPAASVDKFVLSKGHGAPALYAVLGNCGYFDKKHLSKLRKFKSILSGHPDSLITPGVTVSTGSLGQGLSLANGLALAAKLDKKDSIIYAMIGDGECQEGQIWEAAMTAGHYKLDNLIVFLDKNGLQIDGPVKQIMNIDPIADKWRSFGWSVFEIDGHDFKQILDALDKAKSVKGQPSMIVAKTVKGKGVSFMEGQVKYHGIAPTDDELEKALAELAEGKAVA